MSAGYDNEDTGRKQELYTNAEVALLTTMRGLWEQHVAWTRMAIVSVVADLPDKDFVVRRLLRNAKEMGDALRSLYGDEFATEFTHLLRNHLLLAAQLVEAAKVNDARMAARVERRWYRNADEIAAFLNSVNPNWNESMVRKMLYDHLALTKSEAVAQLSGDYKKSVSLYDKIEKQALLMADGLTAGIVMQFPKIFEG